MQNIKMLFKCNKFFVSVYYQTYEWFVGFVLRTLPVLEMPYPMLVLVGPQGVGKKTLAQKLAEDLPDYFGYA